MTRILTGTEKFGTRALVVDAQGNGHYTTIQDAIDAAYSQAPASDARWLVRVAPGEYTESLTLYDYIDLVGLAPGYTAQLKCPASQPAIANFAECTVSNLRIGGDYDNLISSGGSTGTIRFTNIMVDLEAGENGNVLQILSGAVELWSSYISTQQRAVYITTGSLYAYHSILREFNTDGDLDEYAVVDVDGAATIELQHTAILNEAGSGGAAVLIQAAPTLMRFYNCLFRKASGTESIATTVTPAVYLANCAANAAIDAAITGTHDLQVDANF
jgi:hypothetical protein